MSDLLACRKLALAVIESALRELERFSDKKKWPKKKREKEYEKLLKADIMPAHLWFPSPSSSLWFDVANLDKEAVLEELTRRGLLA